MGLALFHIQKVLQVNIVLSKIALVLQLGNIQLRVEHMSLPLPSKNLQ